MKPDINSPLFNDNRNYNYSEVENEERKEYRTIENLIPANCSIIDLGCGNGSLMKILVNEKNVKAMGVEISESAINICRKKNLNVIRTRIDERLPFDENSFDYSICNVTIQMVTYPEVLLGEMKRISKYQIISFPNFAFYKNRIDLLINGRMPKPMLFNYNWYSTGHIHQLSIKDFYELIEDIGGLNIETIKIETSPGIIKNLLMQTFPNLFQVLPIFLLKKI
jgi:methionine biosynthesis protein MetW